MHWQGCPKPPDAPSNWCFSGCRRTKNKYLVDLPGYGTLKVPQELQAHWQAFLDGYFGSRDALRGLVVVMDVRHPLKDYDRQMLGYAMRRALPAHVISDQADKLSRGAAGNTLQAVRMELSRAYADSVSVQLFSGESRQGVDRLRSVVAAGWRCKSITCVGGTLQACCPDFVARLHGIKLAGLSDRSRRCRIQQRQ